MTCWNHTVVRCDPKWKIVLMTQKWSILSPVYWLMCMWCRNSIESRGDIKVYRSDEFGISWSCWWRVVTRQEMVKWWIKWSFDDCIYLYIPWYPIWKYLITLKVWWMMVYCDARSTFMWYEKVSVTGCVSRV
jgi:hypothetical protein